MWSTSQGDVESVFEIVVPDLFGLFRSNKLEDHSVKG